MTENAFVSTRPRFKVNGEIRAGMESALTAMAINLPLHGCAHGELHLTNWGTPEGERDPGFVFDDIALGAEVEIEFGQEDPVSIFKGEVTAIEERYGEGAPGLVLLLQDRLHRLARVRHSRGFEDQSPDDLVRSIAGDAGLQADADISSLTATWLQMNESDLAFLMRIAGRFDIALRLAGNTLRAKPEEEDPDPVALSAQDSALKVRLVADLNHQPDESKVQGYSLADDTDASAASGGMTPAPGGATAAATLGDLGWNSAEIVPHPFARSGAEAEAYAKAHFRRQARRFIHGEIVCQGEPALKAGREIDLSGVSPRLRGIYQIVHCVHRFDNVCGYETHLKVNKGGWQP
ncbi:MAG: contractile injection system protein, VgrG/Pvc8 family [Thiohalomonadaceae bacterium]